MMTHISCFNVLGTEKWCHTWLTTIHTPQPILHLSLFKDALLKTQFPTLAKDTLLPQYLGKPSPSIIHPLFAQFLQFR